ncbi:pro-sigmaK processing inhibitor BofA family protein [Numidum massiliense]|uniref:pro-sigmaK processing inhibitor BofA family protein n=1 Tax=Numidum massiliense TaxID=1522315 RepID=UPI001E4D0FDF|nr:pro-sigmaK processing inhibitor BofA family protein [Numidum massiliense]
MTVLLLTAYAAKPLKWIWLGLLYTAIGGIVLFLINLLGGLWDFHLPINPVTAFVTGVLGLPGLVCLTIVKLWIV